MISAEDILLPFASSSLCCTIETAGMIVRNVIFVCLSRLLFLFFSWRLFSVKICRVLIRFLFW
jgi:hypothetical protein